MPGLGLQRADQDGAQVAGGVAEVVADLQAEPDVAALAHHRGRSHREQGAEPDRAVVVVGQRQRRGRGLHELAHGHEVALAR